ATDLFVHWPSRIADPDEVFVDLSGVAELRAYRWTDDELVLGGMTTYWDIITDPRACEAFPMLVSAARTVGSIQIQTRGTWAGNIANASPAADGVPALMALDAVVELTSAGGTESVRLDSIYLGYKQLRMRPDQIITAIRVPRRAHGFESFVKIGSRRAQAITKVGAAVARSDAAGWRVVANSMAPTVRRCRALEAELENETPMRGHEDFVAPLSRDLSPIDDIRSTASYRLGVLARVLYHELEPVCHWIGTGSGGPGRDET
ncbi:MAG: FAD binding domain-containing protein, partial [Phycisphaerales bacterium]|nr:FAD binding domain-containing protein [Phycisphaerales bacterium]